jgi:hypothetical protein
MSSVNCNEGSEPFGLGVKGMRSFLSKQAETDCG